MADLRYIMDMADDEDGNDKYSRRPGVSDSTRSSNPSSTTKQSDDNLPSSTTDTIKSQPRRRGPLNRPSKSTTTVSSTTAKASEDKAPTTASSSSRLPTVERRSVDSTESMDTTGYGAYTQSSSSSNMPPSGRSNVSSRPISSVPGDSSNIPVKLTPITGRVSRAKKGVPVHTCDICKPPKTFTRAEHLRRHQLSHKPATFQCSYPGCDKTFHRQDLLTRHTQRHEQEDRSGTDMTGGPSRQTSHTPVDNPSMSSFPQTPLLPGTGLPMTDDISTNQSYPGSTSPYPTSHRGSISGQGPMSPSSRSHSASFSQGDYILSSAAHHVPPYGIHPASMDGSSFDNNSYGLGFEPRRSPSYTYLGFEGLPSLTIPDSSFPGHLSQESNWSSASDSPYSTPDRAMIRGYDSPDADVSNPDILYVPHQYPSPHQPVYHQVSDYTTPYDDNGYFDFQSQPYPVRSPTPPTVTLSAQPVENLVTLGHSVPDAPALLRRQKGAAALLSPYSDAAFLTALVPSTAALNAIPRYLDVYWKRFDTLFPIIHRQSVETSDDPVLRCAMAAIGSQFLQSREDRNNSQILHGFASQEARRRPQWGVDVMQAILLCEFYGRFRGMRAVARPSEPFQSLYARDHIFSLVLSPSNNYWHQYSTSSSQVATPRTSVNHDNSSDTSYRLWDEWIISESRRRLLAACFVLDIHTSMYHEHSTSRHFITPTPPIPLTKPTQRLWAAQDSKTWEELISSEPEQLNSISLADEEITADHVATALPLDLAVYLASETLRLPRRSSASTIDISADLDLDPTTRICNLFSGSAVANTYLALHYTPLRDLLAVTGDSWLFSRKLLDPEDFQRRKFIVRLWSRSAHAGVASTFAARALLAFFDTNDNTRNREDSTERNYQGGCCDTSEISDYWSLYVCTLICWSINRTTKGATGRGNADGTGLSSTSSSSRNYSASGKAESEAKAWLKMVASLNPETTSQDMRARREALSVVAMVRKRLEHESIGGKSKLLVDAVRVLKSLEDDPTRARF
ncbi:hypothetical protein F5Y03DRAFT_93496 [Xylaria venustula]|nr:hypothetical protein F5Y03DRAFT_93496 [Xylaria venustula]